MVYSAKTMTSRKRPASKANLAVIKREIKRGLTRQTELRRRDWQIQNVTIGEGSGGYAILPNYSVAQVSAATFVLNATLQGVDSASRVGNQCKESGLRLKGMISQFSSQVENVCGCVRVFLVRDHDGKGTTPNLSDVLSFPSSPYDVGSLVKWDNRKRFSILFDQTFALQAQASGATSANACCAVDIDLRGDVVGNTLTYSANDLSSGSLQNGAIYCFMTYCNMFQNPAATASPNFTGVGSFFFHDV